MALREEFESSGNRLFRWRSYLPLLLLAVVLLAMRDYHYPGYSEKLDNLWEVLCLSISFFGLAIRAFAVGHAPRGTSGRNTSRQLADLLNTTGAYSVVRHPLYLGNFFMGLGPALFPNMWWLVLIYVLVFWLYYERIMFAEEAFLGNRFGQPWRDWATRTPAFMPRFGLYHKSDLPFCWRTVLRRECNSLLGVVAVTFLLEAVGDFNYLGRVEFDRDWIWLVSATAALWVAVRVLKKLTRVLDVEGR